MIQKEFYFSYGFLIFVPGFFAKLGERGKKMIPSGNESTLCFLRSRAKAKVTRIKNHVNQSNKGLRADDQSDKKEL